MNSSRIWQCSLMVAMWCSGAPAQGRDLPSYSVTLPFILFANDDTVGVEREIVGNSVIIQTKIGIPRSAKLDDPVSFELAGFHKDFSIGTVLGGATATGGDLDSLSAKARAGIYCDGGGYRPKEYFENGRDKSKRLSFIIRYCLVDQDSDGLFDHVFLEGTKWATDRGMIEIKPARYTEKSQIPIRNAEVQIVLTNDSKAASGPTIFFKTMMYDQAVNWGDFKIPPDPKSYRTYVSPKTRDFPTVINFGPVRITLLAYDAASSVLRLRVDHGFDNVTVVPASP